MSRTVDFDQGLCSCFSNCGAFCCSLFCPCVVASKVATDVDSSKIGCFLLGCFVPFLAAPILQNQVRAKYNIDVIMDLFLN
ncbi:hypothetical protein MXB_392 [Myxobolus squamalis]|nr:hypothetical protein MXB_392 [Myxobolus squamalis]